MSEAVKSNYENMASIDVSAHIEKKNGLSYLAWAWAVDQLLRADPKAKWTYNPPVMFGETMMVSCTVTAFEKEMTMQLPVMDYRNKAISNPDAFAVNTAMMRCLVKAIALHGLGLYIYAGEDLPLSEEQGGNFKDIHAKTSTKITPTTGLWEALGEEEQQFLQGIADQAIGLINLGDVKEAVKYIAEQKLDPDEKAALVTRFDSKQRSAMTKANAAIKEEGKNVQ